jgi:crotonobetainyl-CoA:carnitine CoA-transferase CaiB-like acyl-CoA transferase
MSAWCASRTREQALAELATAKVPAAPVLAPAEVLTHEQIEAVGALQPAGQTADGVPVRASLAPVSLGAPPPQMRHLAPKIGADTLEVLRNVGYSSDDIEALRKGGII